MTVTDTGSSGGYDAPIGLIGYGEVGSILANAFRARGLDVSAWDIRFRDPDQAQAAATANGVHLCTSMAMLAGRSRVIFSAVTASQALIAAHECAEYVSPDTTYVDLNSASPNTKVACAKLIAEAGAKFVEAAIMSSVPPYGIRVPIILGGPIADACALRLSEWGMNVTAVSGTLGVASATKMCRSIMIKGLEALIIECYMAARVYGVEDAVLESFAETLPGVNWERQGNHTFERVLQHGRRRSEEMFESAATVAEAGIEPHMAAASAQRLGWLADATISADLKLPVEDWRVQVDAVLKSLRRADGERDL